MVYVIVFSLGMEIIVKTPIVRIIALVMVHVLKRVVIANQGLKEQIAQKLFVLEAVDQMEPVILKVYVSVILVMLGLNAKNIIALIAALVMDNALTINVFAKMVFLVMIAEFNYALKLA